MTSWWFQTYTCCSLMLVRVTWDWTAASPASRVSRCFTFCSSSKTASAGQSQVLSTARSSFLIWIYRRTSTMSLPWVNIVYNDIKYSLALIVSTVWRDLYQPTWAILCTWQIWTWATTASRWVSGHHQGGVLSLTVGWETSSEGQGSLQVGAIYKQPRDSLVKQYWVLKAFKLYCRCHSSVIVSYSPLHVITQMWLLQSTGHYTTAAFFILRGPFIHWLSHE